MKKILSIILGAFICAQSFGQSDYVLKFLGIPIDGSRTEVVSALRRKGFTFVEGSNGELLKGEFNGRESHIAIVENRGKVYRVAVFDANTIDEGQIRIRYNNLIHQFENSNGKYYSLVPNEQIPEDENISYEMMVHHKQYQASFRYNPIYNDEDATQRIIEESAEECRQTVEETKDEKMDGIFGHENMTWGEYYADEDHWQFYVTFWTGIKMYQLSTNSSVWFTIHEFHGKYYIGLYYDNLKNMSNGEDL